MHQIIGMWKEGQFVNATCTGQPAVALIVQCVKADERTENRLRIVAVLQQQSETDEVEDTVSYADIYAALKEEMELPSKLLEHVCGRIVKRLFRDFRKIREIEIKLAKRNPPMGADIDSAGVEMHCTRD